MNQPNDMGESLPHLPSDRGDASSAFSEASEPRREDDAVDHPDQTGPSELEPVPEPSPPADYQVG
jgi:hypothetical protein